MTTETLNTFRDELAVKCKSGIDFILAASILWIVIAYVWTLDDLPYYKCIFVFIAGAPLMPMAFLLSKILKTNWKIVANPLQPLGLWLNVAQLFYFPFLIFAMIKIPDYFIMVYAIITGAHLFPYAWLYKTNWYAIFAGIIAVGVLLLALNLPNDRMYLVAVFTSISLLILSGCLYLDASKRKQRLNTMD